MGLKVTLKGLEAFEATARLGGIGRAAEEIGVTRLEATHCGALASTCGAYWLVSLRDARLRAFRGWLLDAAAQCRGPAQ